MQFDKLPIWARTALVYGPLFGSDPESAEGGNGGNGGDGSGPEEKTLEESNNPQLTPEQISKLIRDNETSKANLLALQQEKQEREEADEAAKRATQSKEENQAKDIERLTESNKKLSLVNERNILKIAILENSKYQWNDPADAALMIDRTDIKIDTETGTIEGVEAALKDLAKSKPYMLKASGDNSGNNNGDGGQAGKQIPGQPSGGKPNGSRDDAAKANKRKQLTQRFSVLNV